MRPNSRYGPVSVRGTSRSASSVQTAAWLIYYDRPERVFRVEDAGGVIQPPSRRAGCLDTYSRHSWFPQ